MFRQMQFSFNKRPAWQRAILIFATVVTTAVLLWIGLIVIFALALVAVVVALINTIKMKLTGTPLFKAPQHFHRYQSQFNNDPSKSDSSHKGTVIEGEIVHKDD